MADNIEQRMRFSEDVPIEYREYLSYWYESSRPSHPPYPASSGSALDFVSGRYQHAISFVNAHTKSTPTRLLLVVNTNTNTTDATTPCNDSAAAVVIDHCDLASSSPCSNNSSSSSSNSSQCDTNIDLRAVARCRVEGLEMTEAYAYHLQVLHGYFLFARSRYRGGGGGEGRSTRRSNGAFGRLHFMCAVGEDENKEKQEEEVEEEEEEEEDRSMVELLLRTGTVDLWRLKSEWRERHYIVPARYQYVMKVFKRLLLPQLHHLHQLLLPELFNIVASYLYFNCKL